MFWRPLPAQIVWDCKSLLGIVQDLTVNPLLHKYRTMEKWYGIELIYSMFSLKYVLKLKYVSRQTSVDRQTL
jgi:hypothetical protein